MREDYIERIKSDESMKWFWDRKDDEMFLICTDDLDSLLSCLLICMYRPRWTIGGYFDYRDGIYHHLWLSDKMNQDNTIWIDCSSIIQNDKCISNHLSSIDGSIHNNSDINMNSLDGNYRDKSYFEKYNLSTFLLVASLLKEEGLEIDNDIGKTIALCIDGSYIPYYQPERYKDRGVQRRYLCDVLGLEDIYNVQRNMTKKEFSNIIVEQNLNSKVYVTDEGIRPFKDVDLVSILKYLCIDVDLSILDGCFGIVQASKSTNQTVAYMRGKDLQNTRITSYAITGNDNVSFSYTVE